MMKTVAIASALFAVSQATTVTWTGIIDQTWGTANNWLPAQVPGVDDDVVINDAEKMDATVLFTDPATVKSLTVGSGDSNVHFTQLSGLNVTGSLTIGKNGLFEVNSGAAALNATKATCAGELQFECGSLTGVYDITGYANFGGQPAKQLIDAQVTVTSSQKMMAAGAIQFEQGSTVTANVGVASTGAMCSLAVSDASTGNKFEAKGFKWDQATA